MTLVVAVGTGVLLAVGAALAWAAGGDRRTDWATPTRLLTIGFVVLDGIGAVALAATGESTGGAWLIGAAMVAIGVGAWAARRLIGLAQPFPSRAAVGAFRPLVVIGLAALGLAAYASLAAANGIPLLSGDAQATRVGFSGIRLDAFRWLVPPAALVALGVALATRRRDAWLVAWVAIGLTAGLEILAASRTLPFELGVAAILLAWWAGCRFRLGTWLVLGAVAAVIFLGVLFARVVPEGGFTGPLDALAFAFNRTVGRIVLIQPRTVEVVVASFPEEEAYLLGSTYVRWLAPLRGEEPSPSLGTWLFEQLFPDEPPGGFAAPGILAEGYANFGPIFALALMAALGAGSVWLGSLIARAPPDAATRTAGALLSVAVLRTYATSLDGFVLTAGAAVAWWLLVEGGALAVLRELAPRWRRGAG